MEEFMHAPIAIEVAPFTIADGIDEAQLVEASEMLEREFLSRQPGYLGRSLSRLDERRWADVVLWRDADAARAAMAHVMESPVCRRYFACMVNEDVAGADHGVTLYQGVRGYGAMARVA
jgi:hypothetical protein